MEPLKGNLHLGVDWITNQPLSFVLCDKGNAMKEMGSLRDIMVLQY